MLERNVIIVGILLVAAVYFVSGFLTLIPPDAVSLSEFDSSCGLAYPQFARISCELAGFPETFVLDYDNPNPAYEISNDGTTITYKATTYNEEIQSVSQNYGSVVLEVRDLTNRKICEIDDIDDIYTISGCKLDFGKTYKFIRKCNIILGCGFGSTADAVVIKQGQRPWLFYENPDGKRVQLPSGSECKVQLTSQDNQEAGDQISSKVSTDVTSLDLGQKYKCLLCIHSKGSNCRIY